MTAVNGEKQTKNGTIMSSTLDERKIKNAVQRKHNPGKLDKDCPKWQHSIEQDTKFAVKIFNI